MQSLAPSQFLGDGSIPGNAAMALIAGQAVMEGKAVIPLSVLSFCQGPMGFVGVDAPRQGR